MRVSHQIPVRYWKFSAEFVENIRISSKVVVLTMAVFKYIRLRFLRPRDLLSRLHGTRGILLIPMKNSFASVVKISRKISSSFLNKILFLNFIQERFYFNASLSFVIWVGGRLFYSVSLISVMEPYNIFIVFFISIILRIFLWEFMSNRLMTDIDPDLNYFSQLDKNFQEYFKY